MRDVALLLVVFAILPFAFWRPYVGILLWSWLAYMNPHRLTWGFASRFDLSKLTAAATLLGLLFFRDKVRIPVNVLTIVWILFVVVFSLTTTWALSPQEAYPLWDKAIKIQLFAFLTVALMRTEFRVMALLWVIALSLGFYGIKGGLFGLRTGAEYRVWGPPGSFIEDNNAFALALIMVMPLMWFLYSNSKNRYVRWGMVIIMLSTALSVLLSYSRGAAVGAAAMLAVLWLRSKHRMRTTVLMLVIVPVLVLSMPGAWFDRMNTIQTYEEDNSAMGRIRAWQFGWQMAVQRPIGAGFGAYNEDNYRRFSPEIADWFEQHQNHFPNSHSIYFSVLGEQGFLGLGLFLTLGVLAFRTGSKVIANTKDDPSRAWMGNLASAVQLSLLGYATSGTFLNLAYFDFYYHLVGVMVILGEMSKEPSGAAAVADDGFPAVATSGGAPLSANP